jgi:repressor of nif and glnA expression
MINYDGTTIDPLEVFIRSGMTDYIGAITNGNGRIGASFREFPSDSKTLVTELAQKLGRAGLGALMRIGHSGQALLEIPVSEGRIGAIVIGGLNPVAIFEETGIRVFSRAMSGLMDFSRLFRYESLKERVATYL